MTKYDFLITYGIPYSLMDWLDKVFDARSAKGDPAPEAWVNWLNVWRETLTEVESQLIVDLDSVMAADSFDQLAMLSEPASAVNGIVGKKGRVMG